MIFGPKTPRPVRIDPLAAQDGRKCTAVTSAGEPCQSRAMWHYLLRPENSIWGGAPGCTEDGQCVGLCNAHMPPFHQHVTWWKERHEFEAHGGPCGLPGTLWDGDRCALDVIDARELVAHELGIGR